MFLSRVAISDFRTFPTDFTLDLTPGPGLTLIVGQNGLGKSTFFEALEWCLTGQVKRLSDLPTEGSRKADFLARRLPDGSEASNYGVELAFQPEAAVKFARWRTKEGSIFKATADPIESELISALKAPNWREPILTLGSYLRLTHFLSQSGEQRFAVQDSEDRWSALEAPAGTGRLNRLRERLGNRGVTLAFNRRAKEAQEAIVDVEQAVKSWDELVERRSLARRIAESGGAVSQGELLPQLEILRVEIVAQFGEFEFADPLSPDACIRQIATRLDSLKPSLAGRVEAAKSLEPAPRQWRQAMDDIARSNAIQAARQSQVEDANTGAERLQSQIAEEESRLEQLAKSLEDIGRGRSPLTRAITARASLAELAKAELALAGKIRQAESHLEQSSVTARTLASQANEQRRLERDYATATERSEAIRELQNLHSRFQRAQADAKNAEDRLTDTRAHTQGIENELREVDRDRSRCTQALRDCEQRLQRLRFQASTIESCVASLASVVTDEDTHCPLCSTEFATSELKRLISAAAGSSGDGLAAAEAAVESARESIRRVEERAAAVAARQARRDKDTKVAGSARAAADALQATLRLHQFVANSPAGVEIEDRISNLQVAAKASLDELADALRGTLSAGDRDKTATDAELIRRSSESTLRGLQEELTGLLMSKREMAAIVESSSGAGVESDGAAAHELAKLAEVEGNLLTTQEAANKKHAALSAQLRSANTTRQSLESELKSAVRNLTEAHRLMEVLRSSWVKSGLTGDPSAGTLQVELDELAEKLKRLAEFDTRNRKLLDGHFLWSKAEEFGKLQKQVTETMQRLGALTEEGVRPALEQTLAESRARAQQTQDARSFRDQMIKKLETEARQYANKVLTPLNSLNESFLRVFSCFSNLSVSMGAKTHQASVKLEFVLKWLAGTADSNTAASIRHFLSEGQLAALSVSLLLSMSTAYRWSQWRALVLDDPLQHNDVIHATSFIEVLRNLIRFQGYQVLLSTHDLELADFIRRKMEAAQVDCRTCQFLGTRQTGVKYRVT